MAAKLSSKMADLDLSSDEEDWDAELEDDEELDLAKPAKTVMKNPSAIYAAPAPEPEPEPEPVKPAPVVSAAPAGPARISMPARDPTKGPRKPITIAPVSAGPRPVGPPQPSKGPMLISPEALKAMLASAGGNVKAIKQDDIKKLATGRHHERHCVLTMVLCLVNVLECVHWRGVCCFC